jgi:hypothetical protein
MKIDLVLTDLEVIDHIKSIMCLESGEKFIHKTIFNEVGITLIGNHYKVQKEIYEWFSVPPRKHNFELLGGK